MRQLLGLLKEQGLHHFYFKPDDYGNPVEISLVFRKPRILQKPPKTKDANLSQAWIHARHSEIVAEQISNVFLTRLQPNSLKVLSKRFNPSGQVKESDPANVVLTTTTPDDIFLLSRLVETLGKEKVLRANTLQESFNAAKKLLEE